MKISRKKLTSIVTLTVFLSLPATASFASVTIEQNNLFPTFLTNSSATAADQTNDSVQIKTLEITTGNTTSKIEYCLLSNDSDWSVDIVLAKTAVGSGEDLKSMTTRSGALVGISGSDFQNLDNNKPKDPYGVLVSRGRILHTDSASCDALVFTADGTAEIASLSISGTLSVGGKDYTIDAVNHTPSQSVSAVTIFDQSRGNNVGFNYGTNYIVQNGVVKQIQTNINSEIPQGGYVINVIGKNDALAAALKVNTAVKYSLTLKGYELKNIQAAVKAEKILVKDSASALVASQLSQADNTAVNRTAIGWNKDGDLILVAGVRCDLTTLANIMIKAGAVQAVSLNGGASSGLFVDESYVAEPLCDISNALVFKENLLTK